MLDISVLEISVLDISVLEISVLNKNNLIEFKNFFIFFLHVDVVYTNCCGFFFNHLIKCTSKRLFINICK